jgi:hypothetical protein
MTNSHNDLIVRIQGRDLVFCLHRGHVDLPNDSEPAKTPNQLTISFGVSIIMVGFFWETTQLFPLDPKKRSVHCCLVFAPSANANFRTGKDFGARVRIGRMVTPLDIILLDPRLSYRSNKVLRL